jgi:hypothetical protein
MPTSRIEKEEVLRKELVFKSPAREQQPITIRTNDVELDFNDVTPEKI